MQDAVTIDRSICWNRRNKERLRVHKRRVKCALTKRDKRRKLDWNRALVYGLRRTLRHFGIYCLYMIIDLVCKMMYGISPVWINCDIWHQDIGKNIKTFTGMNNLSRNTLRRNIINKIIIFRIK